MMKMRTFALVSTVAAVLLCDAAMAQGRGGHGARGGAAGPGNSVGVGGASYGGWHGGHAGGYHGGAWYGGYRGWYGPGWGVYVGGPAYWGTWAYPYYGAYPSYYPYPAYLPSEPIAYVENSAPAASYWYYCREPAGYYPYVQQCSQAWMTVVPPRDANRAGTAAPAP